MNTRVVQYLVLNREILPPGSGVLAAQAAHAAVYDVAISDEFDQWLEQANVPFEATSSFFEVGTG